MSDDKSTLGKVQILASITSLVAVPIVLGVVGWLVQSAIADQAVKKDYVLFALDVIKSKETESNRELRNWAMEVIEKFSPVPFTDELRANLETSGIMGVCPRLPQPPPELMAPPGKLELIQPGVGTGNENVP